ncbi:MAG: hypothetical protein RLZZ347_803 [Candidatus Parcubacteria bacterium]|jgi:glycosyltransferase involved in cell wall biosynthesis
MDEKKKKILYVITKGNLGGAQRYVFDLATGLPQKHCEVVVAIGTKDGSALKDQLEAVGIRTIPLTALGRDVSLSRDTESFRALWKIITKERPDILHLNSPKAAGLGALAGRLLRVPQIIFTAHGWTWNEDRPTFQKLLIKLISWCTIILAHHTITISEREREQALALPFVPSTKVTTIRNGVSKATPLPRHISEERLGVPFAPSLITIGAIGELHKNKGFTYLLTGFAEAVKKLPLRLIIIGEGEERVPLTKLIAELGISEKVFLVGTHANASELLSAFDIYILSSIKEGLPYVLLEAGSAGIPLISTDVGGVREIVDDMHNGMLIKAKNSDEIAHAITYLYEHKEVRDSFSKAIKEKITKEFSAEAMKERTYSLYR